MKAITIKTGVLLVFIILFGMIQVSHSQELDELYHYGKITYEDIECNIYYESNEYASYNRGENVDYMDIYYNVLDIARLGIKNKSIKKAIKTIQFIKDLKSAPNSIEGFRITLDYILGGKILSEFITDIFIEQIYVMFQHLNNNLVVSYLTGSDVSRYKLELQIKDRDDWALGSLDWKNITNANVFFQLLAKAEYDDQTKEISFNWLQNPDDPIQMPKHPLPAYDEYWILPYEGVGADPDGTGLIPGIYLIDVEWRGDHYLYVYEIAENIDNDKTLYISREPKEILFSNDEYDNNLIYIGSKNATKILFNLTYTTDGSEPPDPNIPNNNSNSGVIEKSSAYIRFTSKNADSIRVKARFRGYNDSSDENGDVSDIFGDDDIIVSESASSNSSNVLSSEEIVINPSPVVKGENFSVSFALQEDNGFPMTYENIAVALVTSDHSDSFDIKMYENVTINGNETWRKSLTERFPSDKPIGTYKVIIRGKLNGNWFDFSPTDGKLNHKEFSVIEQGDGYASVSEDINISPLPVIINQDFTISFTLKETRGHPTSYEELAIAILDSTGELAFDFAKFSNETIEANGSLTKSATNQIYDSHQPGAYQVVIRGRKSGEDWFDFDTTENGVNPKSFTVVNEDNVGNPPGEVIVNPTYENWEDSSQWVNVDCPGAEKIYCKVETSFDGTIPSDPAEPTLEDHDVFNQAKDEIINGSSGRFEVYGVSGDNKYVKVRFRGYNSNGYGPPSDPYTYRLDLRDNSDSDKPDLIVRDIYLTSDYDEDTPITKFALNQPIRIFTRIKNVGGADVDHDVVIEYYLSPGTEISSNPIYIGHDDCEKEDMTAGHSSRQDYDYDQDDPLPIAPGIYNITVIADTEDDVAEEDENNNVYSPPLVFEVIGSTPIPGDIATPNIDTALIIDSSGSMGSNDPNDYRLEAARFFIDRADDDDFIAIVDFNDSAYVDSQNGTIRRVGDNRGTLKDAVNQINSGGGTAIGEGLTVAYDQLVSSPTANQKIAILLTDGEGRYNDEANDYLAKGWRIYTIGLSSTADEALLTEIASFTGGQYFPVSTEEAARNAIAEIYKQINRSVHKSETTIHQENIIILPGQLYVKTFQVAPGTESLWVDRIIPGSDVEMSLVRPDGTIIDRSSQAYDIYHALGDTYEIYRITNPMAGTWTLRLRGTDVPTQGEPTNYSIAVTADDNPTPQPVVHDSDYDGVPDDQELCPYDPNKIYPGVCGCGISDIDSDGDGTPDCDDQCPDDPDKNRVGVCGCGVADTDSDGDTTPDCEDLCSDDPGKVLPGFCGCNVSDEDLDGNGISDCLENPNMPTADGDGDGTPNADDFCRTDPNKTEPGICGCGIEELDTDGDGTPDCIDQCPNDPNKTKLGICGCGASDVDSDGDGTPDCIDHCPDDPFKTRLGICGCGVSEADSNADGVPDCIEIPVQESDRDNDGTLDSADGCPDDPFKTSPGFCGCGEADADTDGDGALDCNDACPNDSQKVSPGSCGCGVPETEGCGAPGGPIDTGDGDTDDTQNPVDNSSDQGGDGDTNSSCFINATFP